MIPEDDFIMSDHEEMFLNQNSNKQSKFKGFGVGNMSHTKVRLKILLLENFNKKLVLKDEQNSISRVNESRC